MIEIKLEKRYPHSRTEDITDAFMRGYQQGKDDEHRWWSNHCANCKDAEQTEPNSSEKPNNCKDEPQTDKHKCRRCVYYDVSSDYYPCVSCIDYSNYTGEITDKSQTDCAWK